MADCKTCTFSGECMTEGQEDSCAGYKDARQPGDCRYDPAARYYDAGGIETMEIIKAKLTLEQFLGFCLGNAIKYSCRANHKGSMARDIEKVGYYSSFLTEALK